MPDASPNEQRARENLLALCRNDATMAVRLRDATRARGGDEERALMFLLSVAEVAESARKTEPWSRRLLALRSQAVADAAAANRPAFDPIADSHARAHEIQTLGRTVATEVPANAWTPPAIDTTDYDAETKSGVIKLGGAE